VVHEKQLSGPDQLCVRGASAPIIKEMCRLNRLSGACQIRVRLPTTRVFRLAGSNPSDNAHFDGSSFGAVWARLDASGRNNARATTEALREYCIGSSVKQCPGREQLGFLTWTSVWVDELPLGFTRLFDLHRLLMPGEPGVPRLLEIELEARPPFGE